MKAFWTNRIGRLVLLLLLGFGFAGHALASNCTPTSGLPGVLSVGNVKVSSSLAAGATIPNTVQSFTITGGCVLGSGGNPSVQVGSTIVACNFSNATELMPGVYSTSVSGIGVRLRDSNGNPMRNAIGQFCKQGISSIKAGGAYNFSGTWELVRTNAPLAKSGTLTVADGQWVFGVYNTGVQLSSNPVNNTNNSSIYPSGNINVVSLACRVTFPSTVVLPTVSVSSLPSIGSTSGGQSFNVTATCDSDAKVGLTLGAAPIVTVLDEANGILSIQGGTGQAAGIAMQVLDGNTNKGLPMNNRIDKGTLASNTTLNNPMKVQYKRTDAVGAGSVVSGMVFTFDYQ